LKKVFGDKSGSVLHRAETGAATGSHCSLSSLYRPFTATKLTQSSAHRRRCRQKTRINIPGTPTAHARHAYRDSARPQRTRHTPSQAWTEASPRSRASAVSSRTERAAEKEKKKGGSHGTGGERRRLQGRGHFAFTAAGAAAASRRGGGEAGRWRRHAVRAWAVASAAAGRVGEGETPGRRCDARGHAAQRRRVRGE